MVETADLTVAVSIESSTSHIQVMERNVCRGEDQGKYQHQSNKTALFNVPAEGFAQHAVII